MPDVDSEIAELAKALADRYGPDAITHAQDRLTDAIAENDRESIRYWTDLRAAIARVQATPAKH